MISRRKNLNSIFYYAAPSILDHSYKVFIKSVSVKLNGIFRLDWTERAQRVESYLTFLRHSSTPEQGSSDVRLRLRMLDVEKRKVRFFVFF